MKFAIPDQHIQKTNPEQHWQKQPRFAEIKHYNYNTEQTHANTSLKTLSSSKTRSMSTHATD